MTERATVKLAMHLTFWSSILTLIGGVAGIVHANSEKALSLPMLIVMLSLALMIAFSIAVGMYVARLGRSGALWGLLTFVTIPLGMLVAYPMALFAKPPDTSTS